MTVKSGSAGSGSGPGSCASASRAALRKTRRHRNAVFPRSEADPSHPDTIGGRGARCRGASDEDFAQKRRISLGQMLVKATCAREGHHIGLLALPRCEEVDRVDGRAIIVCRKRVVKLKINVARQKPTTPRTRFQALLAKMNFPQQA